MVKDPEFIRSLKGPQRDPMSNSSPTEHSLQAAADEGEKKKLAKENEALRAQIREMNIAAENPDELARARTQQAKNTKERARLVRQLKEQYNNEVAGLKKRVITVENKMIKQAKDFKAEREHCYDLMAQMEEEEKGRIRERVRAIADYIVVKYQACEDMTRTSFFTTMMTFVRQIMSDLERLQGDLAYRPVARPNDAPQAPGAFEALMYS
ncbi:PREDICTED: uncharacterized protein LOC109213303 [Nicotiana attenuata]|uniref:uncharacterized protein LOC109213303 n=1 Tax=Nicotiana attenuata TaxID=49451 RepID=UPI0009051714|nr:PREDICTED: uncharacterized protein LOC109213303 [Nicotiana attenuata]